MPPKFINRPSNNTVTEGTESTFIEACIDGNPFPEVSWYKGTRECHTGGKYTLEKNEQTGVIGITIKKIKTMDENKYTVKIKNSSGDDEAQFSLFVKCNSFMFSKTFQKNIKIYIYMMMTLLCMVTQMVLVLL